MRYCSATYSSWGRRSAVRKRSLCPSRLVPRGTRSARSLRARDPPQPLAYRNYPARSLRGRVSSWAHGQPLGRPRLRRGCGGHAELRLGRGGQPPDAMCSGRLRNTLGASSGLLAHWLPEGGSDAVHSTVNPHYKPPDPCALPQPSSSPQPPRTSCIRVASEWRLR